MPIGKSEKFKKVETKEQIEESLKIKIFNTIEQILENPVLVGEGKAAKVYSYEDEVFCIKEIKTIEKIMEERQLSFSEAILKKREFSFNDIHDERRRQEEGIKMGIRSPEPYASIETMDGRKFIIMETIDGYDFEEIKKDPRKLPADFDAEIFLNELGRMIGRLHAGKMHHRDLHNGNIMVESKTALPVIIDYGHAVYEYGLEDPYIEKDFPKLGHTTRYKKDLDRFKKIGDLVLQLTK